MTSPPTVLTGSLNTMEGCASIADVSGNLLFYTSGSIIYTASHTIMSNGSGLIAGSGSTMQEALIVKKPGSADIYYVFSLGAWGNAPLYYSEVNMSLAAGSGSVTSLNNLIHANCYEKMTVAKHSNGTDYWVIFQDNLTNFRSILVSAAGVNTVSVISPVGSFAFNGQGFIKVSPDGTRIGSTHNTGPCALYDFNPGTGVISNPLVLLSGTYAQDCQFSPDGSKFYTSGVLQWDLCAGTPSAIIASMYSVTTGFSHGSMQLAPDGKIYLSKMFSTSLGVINNPNNAGASCNYINNGISLAPNNCLGGLPNLLTNTFTAPPPQFTSNISSQLGCQTASFTAPTLSPSCANSIYSLTAYSWNFGDPASGSTNTSVISNPSHAFSSLGTYTVHLVLKYCCGRLNDTLSTIVTISQNCLSVASTSITCANGGSASVTIAGGTGPYTYSWLPTNQTTSVATGLYPGTYTVFVYDQGSNITSSITTVFTSPIPLAGSLVTTNTVICNGIKDGAAHIGNVSGGTGNTFFWWSNGISTFTSASNAITGLGQGSWTVIATDPLSGCSFSHEFNIITTTSPSLTVSSELSQVCKGGSVNIFVSTNGTLISWLPAIGLNTTNGPSVTANPGTSQIYTITTQNNGCKTKGTASVNVLALPSVSISTSKSIYCPNETIVLSASGAKDYNWDSPQGGMVSGQTASFTINYNPSLYSYFNVTGIDSNGCSNTASLQIKLIPPPQVTLSTNILQACVPFCSQFKLITAAKDSSVWPLHWQVENSLFQMRELTYCFTKPGTYSIINTFIDSVTACTSTEAIHITAFQKSNADFNYTPSEPRALADEVLFEMTTDETELRDWKWVIDYPDAIPIANNSKYFYHAFEMSGNYPVALIVENKVGCRDTSIKYIQIEEDLIIYIPNAFSPNEDNLNDIFVPVTQGIKASTLQIFNRWGQKIFETNRLGEGWDGTYKGRACGQDVYIWKLRLIPMNSEAGETKRIGEVMLIR